MAATGIVNVNTWLYSERIFHAFHSAFHWFIYLITDPLRPSPANAAANVKKLIISHTSHIHSAPNHLAVRIVATYHKHNQPIVIIALNHVP